MSLSRSFRVGIAALGLTVVLGACGGGGSDDKDTASGDTKATTTAAASDDSSDAAEVPEDICALVTADKIAAITGETGVTANDVPGGGCQYKDASARGVYPTVDIKPAADYAGGIEGAQTGAEGVTGGTAESITVGTATGYFVAGKASGASASQAAVETDNGLIIIVSMAGADFAAHRSYAPAILKLFVDAL